MPTLPLLADPDTYRPCIQNLLTGGEAVRNAWLDVFVAHCETMAGLPVDGGHLCDQPIWPALKEDYLRGLAELRENPSRLGELTVLRLTQYREARFKAYGFADPFTALKHRENEIAMRLFPAVLSEVDATPPEERMELLARGLFAGNLFDMGSRAAIEVFEGGSFEFCVARERVRKRPWAVDGLDAWMRRLENSGKPYRQVLFFVDNAGPDILLGVVPFVRELAQRNIRIVLAANSHPALNDITAPELVELLSACARLDSTLDRLLQNKRISVIASGCGAPLIDLRELTPECCEAAAESDLLVLEGMGRAIESNYDATFTIDTIKVALIKERLVAEVLGVKLFDPVFRFEPVSA